MKVRSILAFFGLTFSAGCTLGPDYVRPEAPLPETLRGRGAGEEVADAPETPSFADAAWFEVFDDPVLQELIGRALQENHDVRIAAERVLQARSFVTIARSELYPDIVAGANYENTRITESGAVPVPSSIDEEQEQWSLFGDLAWELDFWGRIRRSSEAARAELFQTQYARRAVLQSLVTDLAVAYFDLLLLDEELRITKSTYESRQRSLELVSLRLDQGVANRVEYRQAEGLVLESAGLVPALEEAIERQENLIRLLIGAYPGPIARGLPLLEQNRTFEIPVGLPSDLLDRRPDVRNAEEALVAANARIGEAKALLFPTITLTALGGVASEDLSDLVENDSGIWSITPAVTLPIFNAGRLRSNVAVTESQQREAALRYTQTLQNSFREVADALVIREKRREVRSWNEALAVALQDQVELSRFRYRGGVTSYLEVLDSERDHFASEISLAGSFRDELVSYVTLYRALGGGWRGAEEVAASGKQTIPSGGEQTPSGGG